MGIAGGLFAALKAKDAATAAHSYRVAIYCSNWAMRRGEPSAERDALEVAALLHDVGKIGIDDTILRKPGALTDEEYEVMKGHPQKGAEIMAPIKQMKPYIPGIRFHHETLAGTGYPLGLKGDQVKRLKDLEKENDRLRKAVSDLTLEKLILKEAASGNF